MHYCLKCGLRSFIFLVFVVPALFGQARPKKKAQSPPSQAANFSQTSKPELPAWLTTPFDPTSPLSPKVVGHDLEAVYKAIQSFNQAFKGEFETTADYNARRQKHLALSQQLTTKDTLAFVIKVNGRYDADTQLLLIDCSDQIGNPGSHYGVIGIGQKPILVIDKKQMMQNGYGARIEVRERAFDQGMITFEGAKLGLGSKIHAEIPLASEAARASKPDLAILIYGKVLFVVEGILEPGGPPTASRPEHVTILQHQVDIEPGGIWIINQETGAILSKIERKQP